MALYTRELHCTLEELWAIFTFVRFPASSPDYGKEYGKEMMLDVFRGVTLTESSSSVDLYSLWLTDENLWEVTRTVSKDYMVGLTPVGRELLVKVMQLLWEAERETEVAYDDVHASASEPATEPEPESGSRGAGANAGTDAVRES